LIVFKNSIAFKFELYDNAVQSINLLFAYNISNASSDVLEDNADATSQSELSKLNFDNIYK